MAAELSLNPAGQPESGPGAVQWAWYTHRPCSDDADDQWEARALAEDAGNISGLTWPPRSYTCTFCRREFRCAQALGGHMNVHRRDGARRNQPSLASSSSDALESTPAASLLFAHSGLTTHADTGNASLCVLCDLPGTARNGTTAFFRPRMPGFVDSPCTFLSMSHYAARNTPVSSVQFSSSSLFFSNDATVSADFRSIIAGREAKFGSSSLIEELDLELRLGHKQ